MYKDFIETIQDKINTLNNKYWSDDECKPNFIVSILYDKNEIRNKVEQYIMLFKPTGRNIFDT